VIAGGFEVARFPAAGDIQQVVDEVRDRVFGRSLTSA
jgi:hypothetical protein